MCDTRYTDVHQERHTGGQDANDERGYPSLGRVPPQHQPVAPEAWSVVQRLVPGAVLDEVVEPVYGGVVIVRQTLPYGLRGEVEGLFVLGNCARELGLCVALRVCCRGVAEQWRSLGEGTLVLAAVVHLDIQKAPLVMSYAGYYVLGRTHHLMSCDEITTYRVQ